MTIFYCKHCEAKFVKEFVFRRHNCESKQRNELMETPVGKSAFYYYRYWLLNKNNNSVSDVETFKTSKYFRAFIKFMEFAKKINLPDKEGYIKFMITNQLLPSSWDSNHSYISYIQNYDKVRTPIEQVTKTIETLYELTSIFECEMTNIFDHVLPGEIIRLLQTRKISPWLLLFSTKFKDFLSGKTTFEQRILMQTAINPTVWREKFKNNQTDVEKIKRYVKELKL